MNTKLMVVSIMVLSLLPIILICLITDLTKRSATALALLAAAGIVYERFKHTRLGSAVDAWLLSGYHLAALLLTAWSGVASFLIWQRLSRRRHTARLTWTTQPSQRAFERGCVRYLESQGWVGQGRLSRVFVDINRMQRKQERATFVLSAGPFAFDATFRLLRQERWKPSGSFVLVTWDESAPSLKDLLSKRGWLVVQAETLRRTHGLDDLFLHEAARSPLLS